MRIKNNLIIVLVWLFYQPFFAQELPPIQVFTPPDYGAENQNWAIAQSPGKYIYVANNIGLLEYNGAKWELYPSPNKTILRAVAVNDNRIYTGCYMEFGYWQHNKFGVLDYTSLIPTLKEKMIEDEQIWKIIPLDNWILFQSLNRIYLFDTVNEIFKIVESDNTITKMFLVDETIMFQKINDGIYKIENGIEILLTSDLAIKDKTVVNIYEEDGHYLIQSMNEGFYKLEDQIITKWNIEANDLLLSSSVYSSIRLKDKSFAIGTISNGLIHLTKDGKVKHVINKANALGDNTVLALFEDQEQNIWMGLDNGINCINMKSPFRVFNNLKGDLGIVYASAILDGNLYLGTNQGLFYKSQNSNEDFIFIEGTRGQVWNLVVYDNRLFCGHNEGTFIIKDDTVRLIADYPGTWDLRAIPNKPNELLQGNYGGLNVLIKENGIWKAKNTIKGFQNSSRFFEIETNNNIFVNHEYKGVYKLQINKEYTEITKVSKVDELSKGLKTSLIKYNDDLLYAHIEGVFKLDKVTNKFQKDSILSLVYSSDDFETGKLIVDKGTNKLWSFAKRYISYVNPGKLSSKPEVHQIAIPSSLRKGMTGFENINRVNNSTYLYGTSNGYLTLNLDQATEEEFEIQINSIKKGRLGIANVFVSLTDIEEFKNQDNNLEFTYSVPEFNKYSVVEYRHQLQGIYEPWSKWSTTPNVLFENLPFGDYTFNVTARIGDTQIDNTASYGFTIEKPWYLSNTLVAIYILVLLMFSMLMHTAYRRYYKKQQRILLEKSHRELELKQLENEQQQILYANETLSKDIENKNRELAISTMSLIKKNEFLNDIKKELNTLESNQKIKSVMQIIDNNLNNTDDWKLFEEAFNNADKEFLQKMKGKHPGLTSNDLRLCAYLRLNLSSKEIAPLLNISSRSVEVKRYRLRKKMELPHETSLTNYILEV